MKKQGIQLLFIIVISIGAFTLYQQKSGIVTHENIQGAEELIGFEFTPEEIDSMMEGLEERLAKYKNLRKRELPNHIPSAIIFNPLPEGFKFNEIQQEIVFSNYSYIDLPDDLDALAFYSIGELAELMRRRQITSVQLTDLFLKRLKKYGPKLECVITLTEELAYKQAKLADSEIASGKYRGMLHGIPYGIKDLLATKKYKTTWGAEPFKNQIIEENATVVEKLTEAGAVLVAKLTMGALAWGDVWYGGKTRNPRDLSSGSSGSSAGPASATSAGLVPFAIGTETWGSIVSPSTVCGVSGLRPTYGRVSRNGAMALSWSMDKIGPICRNAEDLAIVFKSIFGPDDKDQTVYDLPFNYNFSFNLQSIKVGYLKSDFDKTYDFRTNDSLTLVKLEQLGIKLIPIELPEIDVNDISWILSTEAAAAFDDLTRSNRDDLLVRQIKNAWPNVFRVARFVPAVEYINANRLRYLIIQQMAEIMEKVDIYLAPSWEGDNLLLTNLTGHPCVVIPNGFSANGNPTSISITGRLFEEGKLISFARYFQENTNFHLSHPKLENY